MSRKYTLEQIENGMGFDELYDADKHQVKPHLFFSSIFTKLELKERLWKLNQE